jgi:hypothetical protein
VSTSITDLSFSTGRNLTEQLIADGAPPLPAGFTYRLDIKHPSLSSPEGPRAGKPAASVTARIGYLKGDEWVEVARFTEVTRAHLHGATIAAAAHAYREWGQF